MAEMEAEKKHGQNVKAGDERAGKPEHHHRVNIVMPERVHRENGEARIGRTKGEVEEMKDNESEQDDPAHDHVPGSEAGLDEISAAKAMWGSAAGTHLLCVVLAA